MGVYAICPFYQFEKNGVLYCENKKIKFPSAADRAQWLSFHCCSWNYKVCVHSVQLMKKYEPETLPSR